MGKAKKGRKVDYEDDIGENLSGEGEGLPDEEVASKTKTKKEKKGKETIVDSESEEDTQSKKKKKKKVKGDDDVDETTAGLQELTVSSKLKKEKKKTKQISIESDEEPHKESSKPGKHSKNKSKKKTVDSDSEGEEKIKPESGGFALLALSDEELLEERDEEKEDSDHEAEHIKKESKDNKKGGKKSKKKKKDDDDEDLEQILAELQMEYSGQAPPPKPEPEQPEVKEEDTKKTKKKKKEEKKLVKEEKKEDQKNETNEVAEAEDDETKTMKTAAQKRKEKKERDKQKRQAEKIKSQDSAESKERASETPEPETKQEVKNEVADEEVEHDDDDDDKKKKKKKKGKDDKDKEKTKGLPNKKTIAAMQEALKKIKEEEEKLAAQEAERLKKEEEAERARQEQLRLEQERRERKKAKEKERKERLKAEGKLLTTKQKADRARVEEMIKSMKAMYKATGAGPNASSSTKPKPFTKLKKQKQQEGAEREQEAVHETEVPQESLEKMVEVEIVDSVTEEVKDTPTEEEDVKDSWDAESSGGEEKFEESPKPKVESSPVKEKESLPKFPVKEKLKEESEEEEDESETSSSEESGSSGSDSDEEGERGKTDAEKKREKALERIKKRQEDAEKKKSLDELRAAVVCVLGHVDTGKTKILDKLRRTNVQDGEAGGITQQIGATNVPIDAIKEQARCVKGFSSMELKIPGLLIIDTPGHESFSNLRSRGSSLCDIAILVVDIMHGLEPQTIESLNLLKQRKTPFVVALNKIDRLYDWQTMNKRDVRDIIKSQAANTQLEFEQRVNDVIVQFAEQGMNAALFYNNPDVRSYVSLVPTSAITGEGMGNLLAYIVESCQTMLAKRLMFSEELQATVLEVKAIPGLGTTIDVILVNGWLREGDTVVLAGTDAPIVTQIRSLLMPQPLKELRVKNAYVDYKEVKAAQGIKIAAKDLEKVIAGLNLRVAHKPDEVEILRDEVAKELKSALSSIKVQERGVYVQASTLGSLEALLEFLRTSNIPYSNIRIGPVVKKDVMKASTMLEHDSQYATILAFDVKIERDAQELADSLGVKIFQADIIYHLFDKFMAYREELKQKKRDEFKHIAVFPCKLKILPQYVFNSRDPIVVGVIVEAGVVKEGTPICVPSKDFVDIGVVTSIESNHKPVDTARKGQEVCIKIEPVPGEAPKMFGRHFDEKDYLVSKISRQSIDACKDYFRDDLVKTDWQLMVELKKLFQIL